MPKILLIISTVPFNNDRRTINVIIIIIIIILLNIEYFLLYTCRDKGKEVWQEYEKNNNIVTQYFQ